MERAGTAAGCVLFFHLPLISGSSTGIGIGSNYSNLHELSTLPCQTEVQCGDRLCPSHWLCCHYKGGCGRDHMSNKLTVLNEKQDLSLLQAMNTRLEHFPDTPTLVETPQKTPCYAPEKNEEFQELSLPSNGSGPSSEFPGYGEGGSDSSLLVSPLLVAGVVIGLVLSLSCATIVVGSLRRDGRLRHPRPGPGAGDAPDGFSHGGSSGELRSSCTEEFPQACDFGSYLDILSQVNIMYPDPPPRYDECVGPGATQIYIPTDDPPPYSLMDPCQRNEISINIYISQEEEAASGTTGQAANSAVRLQDLQQPTPSISVISHPGGCAPVQDSGV